MLLLAIFCLWGAGMRHDSLIKMRAEYRLDAAKPLENTPPLVAFTTIALGGFRGILADILWLRASYLQEQGRYFELVQLSDWITKLEPSVTEIWAFHARNMAYNISVMMSDPEDRWRWIKNGIGLLRDEGLLYNAGDPGIYCEIGWLFQHKIGGTIDTDNIYYKIKWAEEMGNLLGGPSPDYGKLASMPEITRRMLEEYKLLPGLMSEIDSLYGPLDWRIPESHALYWAYRGRIIAPKNNNLIYDRMIYQSISALFFNGNYSFSRDDNRFIIAPNFDLLPSVLKTYDHCLSKYKETSVKEAYDNFLIKAVVVLYKSGLKQKSIETFNILHSKFPSPVTSAGFEYFVNRPAE